MKDVCDKYIVNNQLKYGLNQIKPRKEKYASSNFKTIAEIKQCKSALMKIWKVKGEKMFDLVFNSPKEQTKCVHDWRLVVSYKGENGFGLIGYCKVYQCRKCLKMTQTIYYP